MNSKSCLPQALLRTPQSARQTHFLRQGLSNLEDPEGTQSLKTLMKIYLYLFLPWRFEISSKICRLHRIYVWWDCVCSRTLPILPPEEPAPLPSQKHRIRCDGLIIQIWGPSLSFISYYDLLDISIYYFNLPSVHFVKVRTQYWIKFSTSILKIFSVRVERISPTLDNRV